MYRNLLIVEEALRDKKAHWFEYIKTISDAGKEESCNVEVLCHKDAENEIFEALKAMPAFAHSRYLDTGKKRLPGERFYGFLLHSLRILPPIWKYLKTKPKFDVVFVPTTLMHHLLAWWFIMKFHPSAPKVLTLFFVSHPGVWNEAQGKGILPRSSRLMGILLKMFRSMVKSGRVRMAVETGIAADEFKELSGLPFHLYPHPVPDTGVQRVTDETGPVKFACMGFARFEKGSDILADAIVELNEEVPELNAHFTIQWPDAFLRLDGTVCSPEILSNAKNVTIIDRAFSREEYFSALNNIDCMVLPYRNASYYARVSRVAIEAACSGIPMIYTRNSWLELVAVAHGAGLPVPDESKDALKLAVIEMVQNFQNYASRADAQKQNACSFFSPASFIRLLMKAG